MPALLLLVLSALSLPSREVGAWNQQFGDPHSTSYVASNVTYTADWNRSFETFFGYKQFLEVYNPAVSEQGVIFLPLQTTGIDCFSCSRQSNGKSAVAGITGQRMHSSDQCTVFNATEERVRWLWDEYCVQFFVHIPVRHQCFIWRHSVVTVHP